MKRKTIIKLALSIIFVTLIAFLLFNEFKLGNENNYEVHRYCLTSDKVKGIDVSYYQGNIDWEIVKRNDIEFAFIRVSDGLYKIDPMFEKNWIEAKRAGVIRGVYQFFRPNQNPLHQAKLLVDIVEDYGGFDDKDLPCVIDVEVTGGDNNKQIAEDMIVWINYIEEYTGKKPIIYSGPYFWELNNLGKKFREYSLWTAHYTDEDECPLIPDPWNKWVFWQFTGSGEVNGVPNIVDINVYNGNFRDLLFFIEDNKIKPIYETKEIKEATENIPETIDEIYSELSEAGTSTPIKEDCGCAGQEDASIIVEAEGGDGCTCNINKLNNITEDDVNYVILYMVLIGFFLTRRRVKKE